MKPLLPLLLLAALVLAAAGCIQPPAPVTENETAYNLSAVERDPVREAAALAAYFPNASELDEYYCKDPEIAGYYHYMNETENATYFDYLIDAHPLWYSGYQNLSLPMSFIEYLERTDTGYALSLHHDTRYVPLRFHQVAESDIDPSLPVIHLTNETVASTPLLRLYFIDTHHVGLKVLPEEEWQLVPYKDAQDVVRKAYLEWNGDYYLMNRSIP